MSCEFHINNSEVMDELPMEVVERKGVGHPDTICDLLTDRISFDLQQYYLEKCGKVLHYNVDKALLIGGTSAPKFLGGKCLEPVKFYLGDRAVSSFDGQKLNLDEVIEVSLDSWLKENLRYLRLEKNFLFKNEIRPGSSALNLVEDRNVANDTSVGVGYWPSSALEELTLYIDELFCSPPYKGDHPVLGEDIKIMSIRQAQSIEVILACAFVDSYISDVNDYFHKKELILNKIKADLLNKYGEKFEFKLSLNALDDKALGKDGIYMTVTGLSCEGGDSGQVGRGNRVSGLISFMRPQTMEAWAGKNFKTHIGKIYSFAATSLARLLVLNIEEILEANVTLVGKIGSPVYEPSYVYADCKVKPGFERSIKEKSLSFLKKSISEKAVFKILPR